MLSARNASLNVLFVHDDFRNPYKLVHGSAMKAAAWTFRTNETGRIVTISYNASASAAVPNRALVHVSGSKTAMWVGHGSRPFKIENVRVEMHEKKQAGMGRRGSWHGMALIVSNGMWRTNVWNKPFPNFVANPGKALLNIHIEALYDADSDHNAPHGLIGQSYDGDGQAVNGKVDDYSEAEVTTEAMAEGAIEGAASEYKMKSKWETSFKYSRFDTLAAPHRDVSKLFGEKLKRKGGELPGAGAGSVGGAGAAADLED